MSEGGQRAGGVRAVRAAPLRAGRGRAAPRPAHPGRAGRAAGETAAAAGLDRPRTGRRSIRESHTTPTRAAPLNFVSAHPLRRIGSTTGWPQF